LSNALVRVGAAASATGGIAWAAKGAAILATSEQPPFLFELGPPLFAIGLIGLYARIRNESGRVADAGLALACVSIALAGVLLVAWVFGSDAFPSGEDDFTPLSPVITGAALALLAGLLLLGVAARRAESLPARWRTFPLVVALLAVPGLIAGGVLAEVSDRLLEIPLVAFALAWIMIGWTIWPAREPGGSRS
jgi:hypothetical protein